jgi:hypothetical protein
MSCNSPVVGLVTNNFLFLLSPSPVSFRGLGVLGKNIFLLRTSLAERIVFAHEGSKNTKKHKGLDAQMLLAYLDKVLLLCIPIFLRCPGLPTFRKLAILNFQAITSSSHEDFRLRIKYFV